MENKTQSTREALWELMNDFEDSLRYGVRGRGEYPDLPPAKPGSGPARVSGAVPPGLAATPAAVGTAQPSLTGRKPRPEPERPAPAERRTAGQSGTGIGAEPVAGGQVASAQSDATAGLADDSLHSIAAEVMACTRCGLAETRNLAVPGEGDAENTRVLVVGEAPGAEEDRLGKPFVGPAGRYLDKWLDSVGLSRENGVFIANTLKCRPPGNRDPLPNETEVCMPYLLRQIAILKPEVILCVGRISTSILMGEDIRISRTRGRWLRFRNIPMIATFHPSAVLRNDELRRPVWEDMKKLRRGLDTGIFGDEVS